MERNSRTALVVALLAAAAATAGCNKLRARDKLNRGVEAYKNQQYDAAVEDFKEAVAYDPALTDAKLYLATAYSNLYIDNAPSPENIRNGEQAIAVYQQILDGEPDNLRAIDGIASMYSRMAGNPFDQTKFDKAKEYYAKHISLKQDDADPYYSIAAIDWALAYRANNQLRDEFNRSGKAKKPLRATDALPSKVADQFRQQDASLVDEGMKDAQQAIDLRSDYDAAIEFKSLLLRQKADMESSADAYKADNKEADQLADKAQAIRQQRTQQSQSQGAGSD